MEWVPKAYTTVGNTLVTYIPAFKNEYLSIRECLVRKPAFIATLEKEIQIQFRLRVPNLRK